VAVTVTVTNEWTLESQVVTVSTIVTKVDWVGTTTTVSTTVSTVGTVYYLVDDHVQTVT